MPLFFPTYSSKKKIDCSVDLALPLTDPIDAKSVRKSKFHLVNHEWIRDPNLPEVEGDDVNARFNSLDARHNAVETRFKAHEDFLRRLETEVSAHHLEWSTNTFGVQGLGGGDEDADEDDSIPPP
ncbi:hypothetical protein V6N12_047631 [Hibiscus sabdariffa]|uniref:Uncharacterized protein n=1 Tax=Hibiscus sabdariffa TaxID=183260 RepID=A0ABR2CTI6_9ROSI